MGLCLKQQKDIREDKTSQKKPKSNNFKTKNDAKSINLKQSGLVKVNKQKEISNRNKSHQNDKIREYPIKLKNLGNTCWMNAGLQCILNTTPLVQYFNSDYQESNLNKTNKFGTGGVLTKEFVNILQKTSNKTHGVYNPKRFRQKLTQFAPQFTEGNQHDSQQFINFFLDALHEDLNEIKEKSYIKGIPSAGRPDEIVSQECWDKHLKRNKSFIVDLMHGQLKQTLKCEKCQLTQVTFDPFQMLCVEIPKESKNQKQRHQVNLYDCFRFVQREEQLQRMNQFYCEVCKKHVNGTKNINLYKVPQIFIVYIKRFIQNGYNIEKNDMSIEYPLELKLQKFLPQNYDQSTDYDLYAVNIHTGTVRGGHYYAYAKLDEEWYKFNDSRVGKCKNVQSSNAYVLFYQKHS